MPDFVPVSGSIEFRITGQSTATGKKMYHIMHVDCGSPLPTLAECQLVADTAAAWVIASYKSFYCSDIVVNEVRARSNAQEPGPVAYNTTVSQAGTLNGDRVPASQAMCVNLLTGFTGLRRRGKFYTFQADETVQTNGLYSAGYAVGVEASLNLLMADLAAAGFALAVESRRDLFLYQITDFLPQQIPAHLKSRKANQGI